MKNLLLCTLLVLVFGCVSTLPVDTVPESGLYAIAEQPDGFRRTYLLHRPTNHDPEAPAPLFIMLHGAFSSAKQMEVFTGLSELADQEDFIAVYPQGIGLFGLLRHWNSGQCCAKALKDNIDDVGFIVQIIEDLSETLAIDQDRIYLAGHSNGGMLAYRCAAEHPDLFAAVAVVSGTPGGRQSPDEQIWRIPRPKQPVPLLIMHGRDDEHIPFAGGNGQETAGDFEAMSVDDAVSMWLDFNGCSGSAESDQLRDGAVLVKHWSSGCQEDISLFVLDGWFHSWPGPHFTKQLPEDHPLHGFDGVQLIWEFFTRQPS